MRCTSADMKEDRLSWASISAGAVLSLKDVYIVDRDLSQSRKLCGRDVGTTLAERTNNRSSRELSTQKAFS